MEIWTRAYLPSQKTASQWLEDSQTEALLKHSGNVACYYCEKHKEGSIIISTKDEALYKSLASRINETGLVLSESSKILSSGHFVSVFCLPISWESAQRHFDWLKDA
ncbi:MAG TPA: hypothetical protein V6D07_18680 [Trichocoleus sp.]